MRSAARGAAIVFSAAVLAACPAPAAAAGAPAAPPAAPASPQPSENKGRTGSYECKTSRAAYNYYVYVPKSYSDENPAGLHLYFHGQGGGGSAPHFGQWARHFLEPQNLIGINMQYTDGDNGKDTAGKVEAALEAIRQTMADYKVILGRGACGSFSGGGLPHEKLLDKFSKHAPGGPAPCPFNHAALYGSNYWADPTAAAAPMSWFVGVGTKEWDMGQPTLGASQTRRAEQLFAAALKGGCADAYFKVTKDKGHSISDADVRDSAAQFRRSCLAFAPFLYEKDYPEPQLAPLAKAANALALGRAAAALERLAADPKADAALKARAAALKKKVDDRIGAALALLRELAEQDPPLCDYYTNIFMQQLGAHPAAKDALAALAAARKKPDFQPALAACVQFWTNFKGMITGQALAPGAARFLEDARARAGDESLLGKMAAELMAM
ncbi:MAG: hypothetical protein FJ288_09665 [Planctomycetes bacterium]|nr:hypothetical protein [Planctomycetota bacterium]